MNKQLSSKSENPHLSGTGSWRYFDKSMEEIFEAATRWKNRIDNIEKPWLCWNVHDDWCIAQQRIIRHIGWTPVVGWDPALKSSAPAIKGSVVIDFNELLNLDIMFPHFPLEFAFLWARKIAFWHSDLFVRLHILERIANIFNDLNDGEMAAVLDKGGLIDIFKFKNHRYFEVIGCTTAGASKDQFNNGCGWWRHISLHPNCIDDHEKERRKSYYYEHGVGIRYWEKKYKGKIYTIGRGLIEEGHFSQTSAKKYLISGNKNDELNENFTLKNVLESLGLGEFYNNLS